METLQDYRKKRRFDQTPEPAGGKRRRNSSSGGSYVVQKHDASRLHFDFRLEHDGVLKSWAVTRGPSPDPADKRLAVRVEDHPLDYVDFEGTIPEDQYGAGTVMLWDEGTWEPEGDPDEGLADGKLKFTLNGDRLSGGWALVRIRPNGDKTKKSKRENWLLIKERDGHAERKQKPLIQKERTSVRSGRTMQEIASGNPRLVKTKRRDESEFADQTTKRSAKAANSKTVEAKSAEANGDTEIAGVRLTHPDRILYPGQGVTKRALAEYYLAVADLILPHLAERPLSLVRCPRGQTGECFFQKHASKGFPEEFHKVRIKEKRGSAAYVNIDDAAGLVAAAQLAVLELHVWGSHIDTLEKPDRLVFDLDPDTSVEFKDVRTAALKLHEHLKDLQLRSFAMATGGKGIHVIVPLTPKAGWDDVKKFAEEIARSFAEEHPGRYIAMASKSARKGRIFIDYLRNTRGATAITPYSTRAKPGAPVAWPVSWRQLQNMEDAQPTTVATAAKLLERRKRDPWAGYFDVEQVLPEV